MLCGKITKRFIGRNTNNIIFCIAMSDNDDNANDNISNAIKCNT